MQPMMDALKEIEQETARQLAQKRKTLNEAQILPFHIMLIKVLNASQNIGCDQKYYDGYQDPIYGYVLGFKDYLEILVTTCYAPYGPGPYAYEYMHDNLLHKSELSLQQILEQISTNVSDASKRVRLDVTGINAALTRVLSQCVRITAANSINSYRY